MRTPSVGVNKTVPPPTRLATGPLRCPWTASGSQSRRRAAHRPVRRRSRGPARPSWSTPRLCCGRWRGWRTQPIRFRPWAGGPFFPVLLRSKECARPAARIAPPASMNLSPYPRSSPLRRSSRLCGDASPWLEGYEGFAGAAANARPPLRYCFGGRSRAVAVFRRDRRVLARIVPPPRFPGCRPAPFTAGRTFTLILHPPPAPVNPGFIAFRTAVRRRPPVRARQMIA